MSLLRGPLNQESCLGGWTSASSRDANGRYPSVHTMYRPEAFTRAAVLRKDSGDGEEMEPHV